MVGDPMGSALRGTMKGAGTPALYLQGLGNLAEWARDHGKEDPVALTTDDLEDYFAYFRERKNKRTGEPVSGSYMLRDFTSLRSFYRYVAKREGIDDPMDKLDRPSAGRKRIEILSDAELTKLLATCKGRGFTERRDLALLRLLIDLGARRGEVVNLTVDKVDVDADVPTVLLRGKTGERRVALGAKAAEALAFYLRVRRTHKDARRPELWLADPTQHRGPLGSSGLAAMLRRRARDAGVANVHPHRFRHTAYNALAQAGVDGTAVMTQFGWSSRSMLDHYAQASAEGRAIEIIHKLSPGDRV